MSNFGDAFPALTHQKTGLVMTSKLLDSRKQQTMMVPSKTPPFPTATPQVQGCTKQKRYQTPRAGSSVPRGRVLSSSKAGAGAGEPAERRACSSPRGMMKELFRRCRLCSGSRSAPCEQRVKSYLCWNIKAGRQRSAINRAYKLSTDKALILLL